MVGKTQHHLVAAAICAASETNLHEVLGELAVTPPELVEGKVHAAVVDQGPGNGQRVPLRDAVLQQAFAQHDHDAFPVATRHLGRAEHTRAWHQHRAPLKGSAGIGGDSDWGSHLGDVAVDDPVPVVHDEVIQFLVGNVIEGTVFARKGHAVVGAHLLEQAPPLLLVGNKVRIGYFFFPLW